jgi:hypothetical protein
MKTLLQLIMFGILGLASVAHAGAPFCWSLQAPGLGSSATTLKLYASDMGGQLMLSGTASYSLTTFPATNIVLLVVGTAAYLNGNIEASLHAQGVSPSPQNSFQTQGYYLTLNAATLNGSYIGHSPTVSSSSGTASSVACN